MGLNKTQKAIFRAKYGDQLYEAMIAAENVIVAETGGTEVSLADKLAEIIQSLGGKATPAEITSAIQALNISQYATNEALGVVEGKIPAAASDSNQLADKQFVTDSITQGTAIFRGSFATKAALDAVEWQTSDDTEDHFVSNNDYAVVLADESHSNECWRYIYVITGGTGAWTAQYRINEAPMTQAQLDALNSGATSANIGQIGSNATAISQTRAMIAGTEASATASKAYAIGEYFIYNNLLYKATAAIAAEGTITPGTNCTVATVAEALSAMQTALTFDSTPTENSTNPVTSGGVFSAINAHTGNSTVHITAAERTKWNGAAHIYASETQPENLQNGDLWLQTFEEE